MGATLGDQLSQAATTAARVGLRSSSQAINVSFRATKLTARLIIALARTLLQSAASHAPGKQMTMRQLQKNSNNIENIDLDAQKDLKALKKELRRQQVDFHVTRQRGTDQYTVYFAGRDVNAVKKSLEKVVSGWDKAAGRKPMKERFAAAKAAAAERNAARKAERSAEHTTEKAVSDAARSSQRDAR